MWQTTDDRDYRDRLTRRARRRSGARTSVREIILGTRTTSRHYRVEGFAQDGYVFPGFARSGG
jgi:hypothetical protein